MVCQMYSYCWYVGSCSFLYFVLIFFLLSNSLSLFLSHTYTHSLSLYSVLIVRYLSGSVELFTPRISSLRIRMRTDNKTKRCAVFLIWFGFIYLYTHTHLWWTFRQYSNNEHKMRLFLIFHSKSGWIWNI